MTKSVCVLDQQIIFGHIQESTMLMKLTERNFGFENVFVFYPASTLRPGGQRR